MTTDADLLRAWAVDDLRDFAMDEANPRTARIAAQDELSRRAYYEQDAAAAAALAPEARAERTP